MLKDATYAEYLQSGEDFAKKLTKNVADKVFFTPKAMEDFASTIANNLDELDLMKLLTETGWDYGWSIGEKAVTAFMGPCRTALNAMFTTGKAENVLLQCNHVAQLADSGFIQIQNQGGGVLFSQQVQVESESGFSNDTALNVFRVSLDSELYAPAMAENPELYEALMESRTYTYNISLLRNGNEVQPDGKATVHIPIPDDLLTDAYAKRTNLYRVEDDGSLTEMDTEVEGGCFVFSTEHFSLYIMTDCEKDLDRNFNYWCVVPILALVVFSAFVLLLRQKEKH